MVKVKKSARPTFSARNASTDPFVVSIDRASVFSLSRKDDHIVFCMRILNGTFLPEVLPAAAVTGCGVQSDSKQARGRIEGDLLLTMFAVI